MLKRTLGAIAIAAAALASVASADAPIHSTGMPLLSITPKSVHFGRQPVGSTSVEVMTITNKTHEAVHLGLLSLAFVPGSGPGGLGFVPGTCGPPLPYDGVELTPGASCTLSITLKPLAQDKAKMEFCAGATEKLIQPLVIPGSA